MKTTTLIHRYLVIQLSWTAFHPTARSTTCADRNHGAAAQR
jgi:hypothetical protein